MFKLPTSLHWLIEKRGRIDGSIKRIERYLERNRREFEKYQELTSQLSELRDSLAAVDKTLQLHKLQVDPELIPTIYGHNRVTGMKHGELTRFIIERLKLGNDQPVSSVQIVDFILERRAAEGMPPLVRTFLSRSVQNRSKALYRQGIVVRHHPRNTRNHGWWTLSPTFNLSTLQVDDDLGCSP
jgi:hypothetical protein